jgi:hypothetical protein
MDSPDEGRLMRGKMMRDETQMPPPSDEKKGERFQSLDPVSNTNV